MTARSRSGRSVCKVADDHEPRQFEYQPIDQYPASLVIATSGLRLRLPWQRPRLRRENYVSDT